MNAAMPSSRFRVASVSFLNARPLIYGLDDDDQVTLDLDVPSKLVDRLSSGTCDVALLPTIDYQRHSGLRNVPVGGINPCTLSPNRNSFV